MPPNQKVGLGLGANLGDRIGNMRKAIALLEPMRSSGHLLASSIYETEPVDCPPDSPKFLNAVIEIESSAQPDDLLQFCQGIEELLGRPAEHDFHAPRTIDIDILYYGEETIDRPHLTIPHPHMKDREFVMRPLAEIRPDRFSNEFPETASRKLPEPLLP